MKSRKKPNWICHACGTKFCINPPSPGTAYSLGKCECCRVDDVPCTQPWDYGDFKEWPLPEDIDPWPSPKTLDDLIEPVLDHFDFEKVHRAMKVLNWKWVGRGVGEDFDVPSIDRMRETARSLLVSVVKSRSQYPITGTGGFYAEKIEDTDPADSGLILRFILSQSKSYFADFYDYPFQD